MRLLLCRCPNPEIVLQIHLFDWVREMPIMYTVYICSLFAHLLRLSHYDIIVHLAVWEYCWIEWVYFVDPYTYNYSSTSCCSNVTHTQHTFLPFSTVIVYLETKIHLHGFTCHGLSRWIASRWLAGWLATRSCFPSSFFLSPFAHANLLILFRAKMRQRKKPCVIMGKTWHCKKIRYGPYQISFFGPVVYGSLFDY